MAHPEAWGLVCEDTYGSAPEDSLLYWTELGAFVTGIPGLALQVMTRAAALWNPTIAAIVGSIEQWPVIWQASEGQIMRWIRTTYRGILTGGVEQFQYKIDLGNPGNDPDLDEAGCLALAEQLSGILTSDGNAVYGYMSSEHHYTEVGAVTMTASSGTDAQGEGGDMEQSFATQWYMYPTNSRPNGGAGGVSLPFEVACAVTLQTDHRGPSGRGRFYLPPFATGAMAAGGTYTALVVQSVAQGVVNFLNAIKTDTPYVPVVVSPRRIILNEITTINVGKVPDSQRRRRRSQDEARYSLALA